MRRHHPLPRNETDSKTVAPPTFATIFARYQQEIQAFLRSMLGAHELAQDLTQDTFHDAWLAAQRGSAPFGGLVSLDGSPASEADERISTQPVGADPGAQLDAIRRWLFHTAYCKAISARRRWRLIRWESLDLASGVTDFCDPQATGFEDRVVEHDALSTAMARLTPQDAACLMLRVVLGFSAAEVGAIVGASAEVVTKRLSRARRRLRDAYLALDTPGDHDTASDEALQETQVYHAR
ncbi:MAG TPA: sigma-70 family RNA polymerase sigma factor [Ktedonobacterales bacterium]|nr:sigma-70 family RNA polymerase sigma factor [Ktedonobacterales bacterium]